ncbi:MAG: ATP-binding protein [Pseudomonadota bacterium]
MKHLYKQIYLTIIATLVLTVIVASAVWEIWGERHFGHDTFRSVSKLIALGLAPIEEPIDQQQLKVTGLAREIGVAISLYSSGGDHLASSSRRLALPKHDRRRPGWARGKGGPVWVFRLPDRRWVIAQSPRFRRRPVIAVLMLLGGVALVIGLCAYPLVRRLTGRLERLQQGVDRVGAGDFSTRVQVEGRDEVARLATSFNHAAERIENLLSAHKQLLANASHELRTPLSRIRLGLELLREQAGSERKEALQQDIGELDMLIDEILLMSRIDNMDGEHEQEPVDLLAIAAVECAHYEDCEISGDHLTVSGDGRLIQRAIRNGLENAHIHGKPPVTLHISQSGELATVKITDQGSGVSDADREKVFDPFYRAKGKQGVKGSGLGLAIVRQIAKIHGGDATLGTDDEGKTSLTLTFRA